MAIDGGNVRSGLDGNHHTEGATARHAKSHSRPRPLTCMDILRNPRQLILAAVLANCVIVPLAFMVLDREAPYSRTVGTIYPANPEPGSTVEVDWQIKTNRSCKPAVENNLARTITDSEKTVWSLTQIPTVFGRDIRDITNTVRIARHFKLPGAIARGPAVYRSSAQFICDPFHLQHFWPITVEGPDIKFTIGS